MADAPLKVHPARARLLLVERFDFFGRLVHSVNDVGVNTVVRSRNLLLRDLQCGQLHAVKLAREFTDAFVAVHTHNLNNAPHCFLRGNPFAERLLKKREC